MDPKFDKQTNLNLPPPVAEIQSSAPEEVGSTPEVLATPEVSVRPVPPAPTTPVIPAQLMGQQGATAVNDVPATTLVPAPVMADDNDLIEKEWVSKAKEIVDKTKEDPYRQSKEMTTFKADYMQKRYNKAIKLSE